MKKINLKKRIILPLLLSGLGLFMAGLYFISSLENRHLDDEVKLLAESLHGHIQSVLLTKAEVMAASMHFIIQDSRIVHALKSADRDALLALSEPIYKQLNQSNNITHFYFHDPRKINLLRVHKPERQGDLIDRFTMAAAEREGVISSGIELGPLGTFTLRSVLPVIENDQLLGYLELGQEIDDLLQQAGTMFGVELYMLIDKQYLNRNDWESGMKMLEREVDWGQLSGSVLVSKSTPDIPLDLLQRTATGQAARVMGLEHRLLFKDHKYSAAITLLTDAGGRPAGTLIILRSMEMLLAQARNDLILFTAFGVAVGLGILILIFIILGRMEHELTTARQRLIDEGSKKAEMQAEFIQQLQRGQEKLRESEEETRHLLHAVGEGIYGVDSLGNTTFVNPSACRLLGYEEDELIGQPMHETIHHSFADGSPYPGNQCYMYNAYKYGQTHRTADEVLWRKNGSSFPVEYTSTPVEKSGKLSGAVVIFTDITDRKRAELEIEQALHVQRVLDTILNISLPPMTMSEILSQSLDAVLAIPTYALLHKGSVFLVTEGGNQLEMVVQRNLADEILQSCSLVPFGRCLCGRAAASREIVFSAHLDESHEITYDGIQPHGHYCIPIMIEENLLGVLNLYTPDGHQSSEDERKHLKTVADTLAVVIERKRAEESLRQMAHHDMLTGLPNRTLFYDRLGQALALAQRRKEEFTLLFIDLDHFKEVNDTLGHDVGDLVLKQTATRLLGCVERKTDTVARMGGDEFTVILSEVYETGSVELVAQRIIDALLQPFQVDGTTRQLGCSIGIAQYPAHGGDSETLIKHADVAMYHAKRERNAYAVYSEE